MPRRYDRTAIGGCYWRATRTSVRRDCQSGMDAGLMDGIQIGTNLFDLPGPRNRDGAGYTKQRRPGQ